MLLVLEAHRQRLENAAALDIDAFMAVDQDIADGRVFQQRLERPEARHLVENFGDEFGQFLGVERQPLDQYVFRNQLRDVAAHFIFRQFFQCREIDFIDQLAVQPHLGVEQLVGAQGMRGRLRIGHQRLGRDFRQRAQQRRFGRPRLLDRRHVRRGRAFGGEAADGHGSIS
jgi:hypothetical protein